MNTNTFGKWLFGLCVLAYLLVMLWGVSYEWNYLTSAVAGVGVGLMVDKLFSKKGLILLGFWFVFTLIVNITLR